VKVRRTACLAKSGSQQDALFFISATGTVINSEQYAIANRNNYQ
jgi:hypothetical protein